MHLKTLTLRGFKSFASATTLRFEPGITCVVGPNGSGKSNVVDALAWVMGEQGAKSLRGGKMEDVIFAGTAGRPPLGRAEVTLTIDNTDGALPIDYSEVTIARTMFRSGGSEYAINGTPCRLLDIQELLSDSGIGREMHVIVGQGQLDAVLHATPEERRGFIEEAAGVLKHRKRKEKALRKLEAMEANLTRVGDLTAEIRRQLGPLGRQAEVARRAQTIQIDLRDARLRLLADDLVQLTATLEQEVADETALRQRRGEVEQALAESRSQLAATEQEAQAAASELEVAQQAWFTLGGLQERLVGLQRLAAERARLLAEDADASAARHPGRDPHELRAQADSVRLEEEQLTTQVAEARAALEHAVALRERAEGEHAGEDRRLASALRAVADRREGLARLAGQVAARRSRIEAGQAEAERLAATIAEAEQRHQRAEQDFAALEGQVAGAEEGEQGLDAEHEAAVTALAAAEAEVESLRDAERAAERERSTWTARKEALELGMTRGDGAGSLLAAGATVSGVLGSVAALLTVEPGKEAAVAAALGAAADAVVVESVDSAVRALEHLREHDAGRSGLLVGRGEGDDDSQTEGQTASRGPLPTGATWALEGVRAPASLQGALDRLLSGVAITADLSAARELVRANPEVTAVTMDGDLLGAHRAAGGSASAPSLLQLQVALDEASDRIAASGHAVQEARFGLQRASASLQAARERADAALDALHASDADLAAVAERLGQLAGSARSARGEAQRLRSAAEEAAERLAADRAALAELEQRHAAAQAAGDEDDEPSTGQLDLLAEAARAARAAETESRLVLRTAEERHRAVSGRASALLRAADEEEAAAARAVERALTRRRQAQVAGRVGAAASQVLSALQVSRETAAAQREQAQSRRAALEATQVAARQRVSVLTEELTALTDTVHRDEIARAEQRMRIEQLQARAVEDLGVDAQTLVEEYGPHLPVPLTGDAASAANGAAEGAGEGGPPAVPYVRAEQEKRLRQAERALTQLGRVNPLALEEYTALNERHSFLTAQLEDLKASRRDLLDIIREVDERVEQVFAAAYADTAREFEQVFARLFPGGEGRLVLTNPDDLLATGLDVEARPPGKKVKRLSLLSGGERSLTAVALLVAIFKARPSPFYVMDEVEAALDDTNLGRLLTILEELRADSQLIVVTHQKRTMEIGDALYGVSMRGDGITAVVSQRLREAVSA